MKKILLILFIVLFISGTRSFSQTGEIKPITAKNVTLTPNNASIWFNPADTVPGLSMGTYGYINLMGVNKAEYKYVPYNGATKNVNLGDQKISSTKQRLPLFNGACAVPTILDNGDGSITVGDGEYHLSTNVEGNGTERFVIHGSTYTLTDNTMNYLVADYNSGTPIVKVILDVNLINETTVIPIFSVFRSGTTLHSQNWDSLGLALANKVHQSIVKTQRYRRESGLGISEFPTRYLSIGNGKVWVGAVPVTIDAITTNTDNLRLYYHSGGVWTLSVQTQYNNTQYDNGTDLVTLTANRYAVNWLFRGVESQKHLYVVLGRGDYTLAQAQEAVLPAIPAIISSHAVLIGKLIVQRDATTATSIQSAFDVQFATATPNAHNDLTGRDVSDVHPAGSITFTPTGTYTATTVADALAQIDSKTVDRSTTNEIQEPTRVGDLIGLTQTTTTISIADKAPASGSGNYIWNGTSQQAANFNILGDAKSNSVKTNSLSKQSRTDINYVFEGDSRTAIGIVGQTSYPEILQTLSNFVNTGNFYNVATGGDTTTGIISEYASQVYPYRPTGSITESYLFVLIGINDISSSPTPDATAIANNIISYATTAKNDGFKVIVMTTFYHQYHTSTQEVARITLNDILRKNITSFYMLIDLENLFPPAYSNPLYYDEVHLLTQGNRLISERINQQFPLGNNTSTLIDRSSCKTIFTSPSNFLFQSNVNAITINPLNLNQNFIPKKASTYIIDSKFFDNGTYQGVNVGNSGLFFAQFNVGGFDIAESNLQNWRNDGTVDNIAGFNSIGKTTRLIGIHSSTDNFFIGRDNAKDFIISNTGKFGLGASVLSEKVNISNGEATDVAINLSDNTYSGLIIKRKGDYNQGVRMDFGNATNYDGSSGGTSFSFRNRYGTGSEYEVLGLDYTGKATFASTVNSTGYLLNGNNLFSSLSPNAIAKWDGTKFVDGTAGGATNLSYSTTTSTVTVISDTGTDAILPAATQSNAGVLNTVDKTKIDNIWNTSVQSLSGTTVTMVWTSGINATISLTGTTTLTITDMTDGGEAQIEVTNGSSSYSFNLNGSTGYTTEVVMGNNATINTTISSHTTVVIWRRGSTLYYGFVYNN